MYVGSLKKRPRSTSSHKRRNKQPRSRFHGSSSCVARASGRSSSRRPAQTSCARCSSDGSASSSPCSRPAWLGQSNCCSKGCSSFPMVVSGEKETVKGALIPPLSYSFDPCARNTDIGVNVTDLIASSGAIYVLKERERQVLQWHVTRVLCYHFESR